MLQGVTGHTANNSVQFSYTIGCKGVPRDLTYTVRGEEGYFTEHDACSVKGKSKTVFSIS